MFKKKSCPKCGDKIKEKYDFCPTCGYNFLKQGSQMKNEWGMLGKNDFVPNEIKMPTGFNFLFNSLMKALDSQFKQMNKDMERKNKSDKKASPKKGISISITTGNGMPPEIRVNSFGKSSEGNVKVKDADSKHFGFDALKRFSEMPKENPETNVRRLSDRVIYEITLPDVKSLEDVSVVKLENSIEVKAVGEKKGYSKVIPVSLSLRDYKLSKGKLLLELGE